MMRVSSGMMINKYMNQINSSYANQAKLMEQSDGSSLHRPSDDSVKYSRYLTYQNRNTENLQYQDNVKAGASWMKTADAAMVNMTDIYTTLKEKTVDAANDTNNDNDLITAISKEFKAKLYEMVSLGNNQQGDRYLFAGQSDLTQPFIISTEEKDRGLIKVLDDPQSSFFSNPNDTKNLNADDTGDLKQFLEVNDSDGNRYFVNTQNGRIYTEDFLQNGYKDKLKQHQDYVAEGDEYAVLPFFDTDALNVAGYFENTGVIRTEGKVAMVAGTTTADQTAADIKGIKINSGAYKDTEIKADKDVTFKIQQLDDNGNPVTDTSGNPVYDYTVVAAGTPLNNYLSGKYEDMKIGNYPNKASFDTGSDTETTNVTVYDNKVIYDDNYDKTTYKYGDKLWLASDKQAVADVPVYIKDKDGNTRVVAKGNTIKLDGTVGEEAFIGVPLDAVKYETGTVVALGEKTQDLDYDSMTFDAGKLYTFAADGAIADADVEYTIPDIQFTEMNPSIVSTKYTVKAGEPIPGGKTIRFLTNNTNVVLAQTTNAGENEPQKASYLATLKSQIEDGTISGVVADEPVSFKIPYTDTDGSTQYNYTTVAAGDDLSSSIVQAESMAIGNCGGNAATFNDLVSADSTANTIVYYSNMPYEKLQTGSPVSFTDADGNAVDTITLTNIDVMIKDANGNARIVKGGNPITLNKEAGETEAIIMGINRDSYHYSNFTTIKQPIVTYQGDAKYISMVKLNGSVDQTADTINATGQDLNGSNIFDDANSGNQTQVMSNGKLCYVSSGTAMINDMFTVCAKLEHGDRKWMRTDGITVADKAHEVITTAQSRTAARQNVYDSVQDMLTKQNETITDDINNVSGTDIAALAVKLMEAQTIYNMSLSMGSRILPPSLADYL